MLFGRNIAWGYLLVIAFALAAVTRTAGTQVGHGRQLADSGAPPPPPPPDDDIAPDPSDQPVYIDADGPSYEFSPEDFETAQPPSFTDPPATPGPVEGTPQSGTAPAPEAASGAESIQGVLAAVLSLAALAGVLH